MTSVRKASAPHWRRKRDPTLKQNGHNSNPMPGNIASTKVEATCRLPYAWSRHWPRLPSLVCPGSRPLARPPIRRGATLAALSWITEIVLSRQQSETADAELRLNLGRKDRLGCPSNAHFGLAGLRRKFTKISHCRGRRRGWRGTFFPVGHRVTGTPEVSVSISRRTSALGGAMKGFATEWRTFRCGL